MPALQVRDFPATLYDELKECAARNHRSIAQQTIIAVEEMLSEASAPSSARAGRGLSQDSECAPSSGAGNEFSAPFERGVVGLREGRAARAARSRKRQQLFEECDEIPWKGGGLSTEISSRWFARDATGFRIAIGMRWIRSARRRNQRRR